MIISFISKSHWFGTFEFEFILDHHDLNVTAISVGCQFRKEFKRDEKFIWCLHEYFLCKSRQKLNSLTTADSFTVIFTADAEPELVKHTEIL